jgi:hypothetical protein
MYLVLLAEFGEKGKAKKIDPLTSSGLNLLWMTPFFFTSHVKTRNLFLNLFFCGTYSFSLEAP